MPSEEAAWPLLAERILADAERKAQQIIAEAMERAASILDEARLEMERRAQAAEQEARERGMEEGRRAARLELAEEKSRLQAKMDALAQELREDHIRWIQEQRKPMVDLVMAAARRLLQRELALSPADVATLVDELLGQVVAASTVYVRVHPDDCESVREASPQISLRHGGAVAIQVVPDVSLARGDCVIAADAVEIDARVEVRLNELSRVLAELAEEGPHGA
ncbi:Flagellar assembly protein FliH/Type III secretion system HrpE [Alicyclobacillus acidocaldarius subsp. acidocaldarius Tc-4-1]|uniref:Flagellar assembly protein FliH/Type III secretion system HrpE n=1 Tax=Alicyclobacillus acidocaldarius (strain Tc-4-1) TaxID=1048834 RepID=F8IHX5_ALIAT|nr:Flagellar assembly protein FliH/Type III secretion system HrpE [Alicyclobacillus acidocaldarius subsp. acidocaldarius Tc-4-1]